MRPVSAAAIRRFARGEGAAGAAGLTVGVLSAARRAQFGFPPSTEAAVRLSFASLHSGEHLRRFTGFGDADWLHLQTLLSRGEHFLQANGRTAIYFPDAQAKLWLAIIERSESGALRLVTYFRIKPRYLANLKRRK